MELKLVDVDAVEAARDAFRKQLGLSLEEQASSLYKKLWLQEDHSMNGRAYGRRKLRNMCLWLLMKSNEHSYVDLCTQQFAAARTMTDQIASLALLVNCSIESARTKAIDAFYKQWADNELVMDKWLALQATCELPHTLERVKQLMEHPAFSIKNPNKVRALIGAFCLANPRLFHAKDGSGYAFLAEKLLILDKINPQVAARLANPFTRYQHFDKSRQGLIRQQMEMLTQADLSRDLREVIDKSLA